ncbi:unnamed protein product [Enterobius vermicularis]|uniref:Fibronectin type-III domain-containing protein n=1 Tax=Enterobius vermicularis TaxID=51028 RepID=A0A0N4VP30_ENTVE|nr:unnamed protein product [Enterobius vermicularis]
MSKENCGTATKVLAPTNVTYKFTPSSTLNFSWNGPAKALYYLQFSNVTDFGQEFSDYLSENSSLTNWSEKYGSFCDEQFYRLYSVSVDGVSDFTSIEIPSPTPQINATLKLTSLRYLDVPYEVSFHRSNASLEISLEYEKTEWPLGDEDLIVTPMFHMINCDIPDLSSAIPQPTFEKGTKPRTLVGIVGADMMYRRCQFLYYLNEVSSRTCGDAQALQNPDLSSMRTLKIECGNVEGAPCSQNIKSNQPPLCGQFEQFRYQILNKNINARDSTTNITVNVTFRSTLAANKKPLYFVAFYGHAKEFAREIEADLIGVDLLNVTGNATNCPRFKKDGNCVIEVNSINGSIIITDLRMDVLYGVTICAVMDADNLDFPVFTNQTQNFKSKASRIYIDSRGKTKRRV